MAETTHVGVTPDAARGRPSALGADLGVLGVAVVWGSSYAVMQIITGAGMSVPLFLALRFAVAVVPLLAVAAGKLRRTSRDEVVFGLIFGVLLFAILTLETTGVQYTSAANAGFLITTSVVLVPVCERVLGGRRRPARLYAMTLLGLLGCGILAFTGTAMRLRSGDLIVLAAALIRAIQIYYSSRHAAGRHLDPVRSTMISLSVVAALGLFGTLFTGPPISAQVSHLDPADWLLIGYLGIIGTAYAFGIQLYAVRATSPTRVAIIMSTEPVFAAMFAVLIRHDRLSLFQILGGLLIMLAALGGRMIENKVVDQ